MIEFIVGYLIGRALSGDSSSSERVRVPMGRFPPTEYPWRCYTCGWETYDFYDMQRHMVLKHPDSGAGKELIERGCLTDGSPLPKGVKR